MKQRAERMTENAVKILLQTLQQQVKDTATALDEYEATHTEYEADQSKQYHALVAGHFSVKEAIDDINKQLNKK